MSVDTTTLDSLTKKAKQMRVEAIQLAHNAGKNGAHLGGGLSAIEIMTSLYGYAMNVSRENRYDLSRDRFLLSKGHGTLAYYTALCEFGLITKEKLYTFENNGGELPGQPMRNMNLGIEVSSGSLGMGISIGVGMALAAKLSKRRNKVYILLGDGECNEGSVWEAAMSAVNFELSNIIVIVDQNGLQSDGACEAVFRTAPLKRMWDGFGWKTFTVNGHDIKELCYTYDKCIEVNAPCVILAETIKGKGVSFMENEKTWHHGVMTDEQYEQALKEVLS